MSNPSVSKPLKLGIAGLGTVGGGVVRLLQANANAVTHKAGRPIEIVAISAKSKAKDRGIDLSHIQWVDDPMDLVSNPKIDVVVELIGGANGIAYDLVCAALKAHKGVVTANKALIALHGDELAKLAEEKNVPLLFEAAVAGGIPVIKTIKEALTPDRLKRIGGILNGTCNYILTAMAKTGCAFNDILKETQELGYAEADPSTDIDGFDAAHKLAILASLGFGHTIHFKDVFVEGIRGINPDDLHYAKELGYTIKLIGIAQQHQDNRIELRVHPALLPYDTPLARVDGVTNAVFTEGEFSGRLMLEGAGAGEGPTSTAVSADIIDIARGSTIPMWGTDWKELTPATVVSRNEFVKAYYIRLMVQDKPGVVADIATILKEHNVSLRSLLQHGATNDTDDTPIVPIILVTHKTKEESLLQALQAIQKLPVITEKHIMLRIEEA
ncbi:Homoserine dehydrogenase (ThrA) (PDB:5AVO) (PUBMED:29124164) [Commensalibacter communis]|uniref:homoserine dehydrogenase n=1 Tax=Commensalibacter communis TaxID=2972786 RepID=UPI0022FFA3A2|nr:homoserine dehydrogenase [Commensalibacter communis]CAI3957224.1 Homoserine dehydrogenase (ThrA) (PDB:5AVO) (PUBMED:29124164) [Commensalibacter communis]